MYSEELVQEMQKEALERMRILGIDPDAVNSFMYERQITYYDGDKGKICKIKEGSVRECMLRDGLKDFDGANRGIAYLAIEVKKNTLAILFVPKCKECWEQEKEEMRKEVFVTDSFIFSNRTKGIVRFFRPIIILNFDNQMLCTI